MGAIRNWELVRMSHKLRSEGTENECWCRFRAESRVKLGLPCKFIHTNGEFFPL